jgi:outer membrane receptor protein involved in Fe transport
MTSRCFVLGRSCRQAANAGRRGPRAGWRSIVVLLPVILAITALPAFATIFSTVKGVVHDPQHRPIPGAVVTLKAAHADWTNTSVTNADGEFLFAAVPVGDYTVAVSIEGFASRTESVTVVSGSVPILHVQLALAGVQESVTVSAAPSDVHPGSTTPTTLVSRQDIQLTPGADRPNGLEAITDFVPGAYVTHDQLHVRGGHQVSWFVDGVPVPNTNIASNVGPQFDPNDVDYLEVQRGSYDAQYGDRTYAVFNVVPRTGFERQDDADVTLTAGSDARTSGRMSFGGHTERFAYFASANANRSNLGLGTPVADIIHDREGGGGGFLSLILNATPASQLRLVASARHDVYQVPNTPGDVANRISDDERETDAFVNFSWVRTFKSGFLLTVSPFYHLNSANYEGGPNDPIVTVDERRSQYGGAQVLFSGEVRPHALEVGFYGFRQQDDQLFALTFNDGSNPNFATRERPSGSLVAVFAQDKIRVNSWLTLTGGVRQTRFSGGVTETATSPRAGATVQVPKLDWVVRAFYGRYYQAPPLVTASGPLLQFVTSQNLGFIALRGERDVEYQVGVTVPVRGWTVDADRFRTRAQNYFDHNPVGNSNVFFPLTIDGALIRGTELTVRSPRSNALGQVHLAYSYQIAEGQGAISGGLTDFSAGGGSFLLDHDQRHTFSAGFDAQLRHGVSASANVSYGSGFTDNGGPAHLPGHTTVDLSLAKTFSDRLTLSLTALNVANSYLLIDNSLTFGGTHFNSPRQVYAQFRYRFHY